LFIFLFAWWFVRVWQMVPHPNGHIHSSAKTSPYDYLTYHVDVCVHVQILTALSHHRRVAQ
jgi:hypothetical protein